jgi:hypothetical protein
VWSDHPRKSGQIHYAARAASLSKRFSNSAGHAPYVRSQAVVNGEPRRRPFLDATAIDLFILCLPPALPVGHFLGLALAFALVLSDIWFEVELSSFFSPFGFPPFFLPLILGA